MVRVVLAQHDCGGASSRLRHIIGVHLGTALTDSGVEDARKRARSACRSSWSLWSRCRCLCNCLDPFRLERTLVRLASLFRSPARARINYDLRGLAAWVVLGSPACNPSIFWPKLEHRVCGRSDKTFKQQMVGRRLSQGEAKRFLAEFERRD